ncbi:MAG: OB-fold domain-containing protein [Acidimicrobiales bacterium]|nr:OB-fold domain-containing protein [Acidimicrobiales bacterium]
MTLLEAPTSWQGPVPAMDPLTEPYWDSLRQHRLALLRCRQCGYWLHYPVPACRKCLSDDVEYQPVSGKGSIYTFSVVHREFGIHFPIPWVAAFVELVEQDGLRLPTNIVGCAPDEVSIGMPVQVTYRDYEDGLTLALFEPDVGGGSGR